MKVQILSDLHIDSYAHRGKAMGDIPHTSAEVIIVAGDTANSDQGMPWLQEQAERLAKPIVTIAGNHEYFGEDVLCFDERLKQWDNFSREHAQGVKVLQCSSIDIADVRILGCTLWTDYQYQADEQTIASAMAFMRDYQQIRAGSELFSPEISMQIHAQHRQWLYHALQQAYDERQKCVVVTHHSVSPLSVSKKYAHLSSNAAFVSDFSVWMYEPWAPKLWVHGHTHEAFDYQLGNTRVVVNPRAYPGEVSSTGVYFDWSKVVCV
ncbi:metallophosphoesterase [Psychrobacter sp. I-STPA6b]|uniref:metallophosphoesterase n=1 Tax=Psychrobacter sp. I-STPA6b TaxID=2585718 RepID=UPI001D0C8BA6|nr:metallophosphoesterase [Psychrobacter sp. I-STPA6b]